MVEERYENLFRNLNVGVYRVTPGERGQFVDVNPAFIEILGYHDKEQLLKIAVSDIYVTPGDRAKFSDKVLALGTVRNEELRLKRKDGRVILVSDTSTAVYDENRKLLFFDGILEDITSRREAERELVIKNCAIESSINAIAIFDLHGNLTYANPSFVTMWGYLDKKEMSGKPMAAMLELEGAADVLASVIENKGYTGELVAKRNDGSQFNVQFSISPVVDNEGTPICVMGFFLDITELRRAREERDQSLKQVEEQRDRLQTLIGSITDEIWFCDADARITQVNRAVFRNLGFNEPREILQPVSEWLAELEVYTVEGIPRAQEDAPLYRSLQGESLREVEEIVRHPKNGKLLCRQVNSAPLRSESGEIIGAVAVIRDVTKQKQMEREREGLMRDLRERIKELTCLYELDKITRRKNTTVERVLTETVTFMGRGWQHPEITESCIVFEGKEYKSENFKKTSWMQKADIKVEGKIAGSVEVCYLEEKPERDEGPFLKEERNLMNSITEKLSSFIELKRAETKIHEHSRELERIVEQRTGELRDAQEELTRRENLAVMGQLAGSVGHEIRNPLSVISGSAYYLKMRLKDADEKIAEHLTIIDRNVWRAEKIVAELLDFSRTRELSLTEADVNSLIREALESSDIPEIVCIRACLNEDIPRIVLDVDQIRGVFLNIISNAVHAMPKGGELEIVTKQDDHFVFAVFKDTGKGIPKKNLSKIFDPLFTTKTGGIGLGLAIVRTIVEEHGGRIDVESEVGKGTVLTVRLPIFRKEREEPSTSAE